MDDKPTPVLTQRESVWDYPRPPAVMEVPQRIRIIFNGETIVDSRNTWRVLETSHPPVYYIPPSNILPGVLQPAPGRSLCEWKGEAAYFDVTVKDRTARKAAWTYLDPYPKYAVIKDAVAFYANKMDACFVGEERVKPQAGNFYGGWITSNLVGPFKGEPGTSGW